MNLLPSSKLLSVVLIAMTNLFVVTHSQSGGGEYHDDGHHGNGGGWLSNETKGWSSDDEDPFRHRSSDDRFRHGSSDDGFYCRDEDDFFNRDTYWTTLSTCGAEFVCILGYRHNHHHRYDGENGTFVCRTTFHPITGEPFSRVRCIPTNRAWETDVCGCCGETCPDLSSSTSCLDQADTEENDVVEFALGTSDMESSSQLSSDSPANIFSRGMTYSLAGWGVTMLLSL